MADLAVPLLIPYPQIRNQSKLQQHFSSYSSFPISKLSIIQPHKSKKGSYNPKIRMAGSGSGSGQDLTEKETIIPVPDTEAIEGSKAISEQLTPHEMWTWNSLTHWKHWHGFWTMYIPLESPHVKKSYKSVRSLWAVDKDRIHLYHRNQWYAFTGYEGENVNWEYGPWAMYKYKHSMANGIWHPNSLDHRILMFQNGDLGWVQLALKPEDPNCVIFNELHFMASLTARMPVVIGYDSKGQLSIALMVEEALDSDRIPDDSWKGRLWKHNSDSIVATRDEPSGIFVGNETNLTTSLLSTTREAQWKGYKGNLNDDDTDYTLVHLPHQVTACVPKKALVGKPHSYYVSWIVNENQVRVISACYFANGNLQYVKSGTYNKVSN